MDKTCLTCKWAEWKNDIGGICKFPEITFPNCYLEENKYPPMVYCITPNTKPDCLYWTE